MKQPLETTLSLFGLSVDRIGVFSCATVYILLFITASTDMTSTPSDSTSVIAGGNNCSVAYFAFYHPHIYVCCSVVHTTADGVSENTTTTIVTSNNHVYMYLMLAKNCHNYWLYYRYKRSFMMIKQTSLTDQ